jgi:3-deoxy-7-phosphoheptulonate synthase/chorismate mutase
MNNKEKINLLRIEIDKLDQELVDILLKRINLAKEIHKLKSEENHLIVDLSREINILDNLTKNIEDLNNLNIIKNIYSQIFQEVKQSSYKNYDDSINELKNEIANNTLIIAGPCSVESFEQLDQIAKKIKNLGIKFLRGGIFKARTNPNSFQGLREKGLELFYNTARKYDLFTVSEFLDIEQAKSYFEFFDVIVVGSRNMTNFEFLKKLGNLTATNQKTIILKRGFGSTIDEFISAANYIINEGNPNVVLCLRGIRTFENGTNFWRFTPDLASLIEINYKTNLPVIFDPSHSAGNRNYVPNLSVSAKKLGFKGLMIEIHPNPDLALSDSKQTIDLDTFEKLINSLKFNND